MFILVFDGLLMIQQILSFERDHSYVGSVVANIKRLASGFSTCIFKHFEWKTNAVAHILARRSELSVCNLSFDVVPECIQEVLCDEVSESIKLRHFLITVIKLTTFSYLLGLINLQVANT
jgi:hypothetical protein